MDEKELGTKKVNSKTKILYDVGYGEIFWKNFLAGFGKGLGEIFVWLIFLFIIYVIFINVVLPRFMPIITTYTDILKSLSSISNLKRVEQNNIIPSGLNINIQKLFGQ